MKVLQVPTRWPIKMWTDGVPVEEEAINQLKLTADLPFVYPHVAAMPDVHHGKGSTVGSVIPTDKVLIPAAVGVDIGCGMMAVKTTIRADQLPDSLTHVRSAIEAAVPHGRTDNGGVNDRGAWGEAKELPSVLSEQLKILCDKHPKLDRAAERCGHHIGTLGTGNHFIEMCTDQYGNIWVMLHSGSRGIGNAIGQFFINKAKEEMERFFISLPDKDLSYLPEGSKYFLDYTSAVHWAQKFAILNRQTMMEAVMRAISRSLPNLPFGATDEAVNCHHNYVSRERHFGKELWITRKGAVSARLGELGIIPGSMGAKSFIVEGLGNRESLHSCSHGAGRSMSRTAARKLFTVEDHIKATEGVECRKDEDVIDETPAAYKNIDAVMKAQEDLVKIRYTLKQILCVKG